jgi:hypothetical protein
LTVSPPAEVDALALAEPEPVLAAGLEVEVEVVELELELVHPDIPSRAAAATVTPSQVTLRMLKVFMRAVVRAPDDTTRPGATREHGLEMTRKQLISSHLLNSAWPIAKFFSSDPLLLTQEGCRYPAAPFLSWQIFR